MVESAETKLSSPLLVLNFHPAPALAFDDKIQVRARTVRSGERGGPRDQPFWAIRLAQLGSGKLCSAKL
jgi:hypothetical protein